MNFILSFFTPKINPIYEPIFNRLPLFCQKTLSSSLAIKDQESILETLGKQTEEKIELICIILGEQFDDTIIELCKREVRFIKALLKIDISFFHDVLHKPEVLADKIKSKYQDVTK